LRWRDRIESFVDGFEPWIGPQDGPIGGDPLEWPGYADLLARTTTESGTDESVVTGRGLVPGLGGSPGLPVAVIDFDFDFVGGSMGLVAGERIVRALDRARAERLPILTCARSGGARIQEGMLSLIQMARIADAARAHAADGLLQVAYLDSPTTGGVYASLVSLADVIWAAPGATVGFAGPRVVEHTTGETLPDDAHSAESAFGAGLVDAVLEPTVARDALSVVVGATHPARVGRGQVTLPHEPALDRHPQPVDAWAEVVAARDPGRPSGRAWLDRLVPTRVPLHGDRAGGVDAVVLAGVGCTASGTPVAFVALDRHTADGRPRPAGYRLARRVLTLAARVHLPVLTIVDTPGADPSDASERTGIAREIARTFADLSGHPDPTVSLVVGEGGSGGALAFAATDRCYLLPGSIFSVIGPEGAASILARDAGKAPEMARQLRLTGPDLVEYGIADGIVTDDQVETVVEAAFELARPGEARARLDAATRRWLHSV
jgi:acetyl-CoA carboxylase carboxyl transferase subunit beta